MGYAEVIPTLVLLAGIVVGPKMTPPFSVKVYFRSEAGALVDFHVHVGCALVPPCVPSQAKPVNSSTGGLLPIEAVIGVFGYCVCKASNGLPLGDDCE